MKLLFLITSIFLSFSLIQASGDRTTCATPLAGHLGKLDTMYTPWRDSYDEKIMPAEHQNKEQTKCVFCNELKNNDEQGLVLKRLNHCAILLNRYPYSRGHILILPLKHTGNMNDLSVAERSELMEAINYTMCLLKQHTYNTGMNVGINVGRIAGASIPDHMHVHILPRYPGDTNWLAILGGTKVIAVDPQQTYKLLKPIFESTPF